MVREEFYKDVLDHVSDGVYFITPDRRITYWNAGAQRITGYSPEEVIGHGCWEGILRHVNAAGRQLCLQGCPLQAVMKDGKTREAQLYLHHKDGHRVAVSVRGQALRDSDGEIVGSMEVFSACEASSYSGIHRDRKDDSRDAVTGLSSRRFGELHLDTLMRAVADGTTSLGMLYADADHFKDINDTYGHRTGDAVLRMVGQSLVTGLRREDVPVRWGGEEFVALLPGIDEAGLTKVAERVRMLVENSWIQRGDKQIRATVSVGATMAVPGESPDDLTDRADQLMYASKRAGRNRVTSGTRVAGSGPGSTPIGVITPISISPSARIPQTI